MASSSLFLLKPKFQSSSLSSSFSLLNLFSTSTLQPQSQRSFNPNDFLNPPLLPSEAKLLDSILSLITSHHTSTPTFTSQIPPTFTIPSLSSSLSKLSPSPLPSRLPLLLLDRFSYPRHGVPFPQLLSFFNWWLSSSLSSPETRNAQDLFVKMLDLAAKHRHFDVSWHILDTMKELEMPVPHSAFGALTQRYVRAGRPEDAIKAFHRMGDYGLETTGICFSILIGSLAKKRFGKEAQEMFDLLKEKFPPDVYAYSALVQAWCRAGKIEEADRVFLEMKRNGFSPNVHTYTAVIEELCRCGQIPRAQEVFCQMICARLTPKTPTFNNLIRALVKVGRTEQVPHVHNQMKKLFIEPDVFTHNFIIDAQCGKGQRNIDGALKVLNLMTVKGVSPSAHSFNPIFRCFLDLGDTWAAYRLYQRIREFNCKPNTVTYNLLMRLFSKEKSTYMMLVRLKREMDEEGVEANVNTYRVLIKTSCEMGHSEKAYELLREMVEEKCLKPTIPMYEMVLALLRRVGQLKEHGELVEMMAKRGFMARSL